MHSGFLSIVAALALMFVEPNTPSPDQHAAELKQASQLIKSKESSEQEQGFAIYQGLAEKGHLTAIYELGQCYQQGLGTAQDAE